MKNVKIRNTSAQSMRAHLNRSGRFMHVSQWFKPVEHKDAKTGVVAVKQEAQYLDLTGKEPLGKTYNAGKNALKRLRRAYGLSLRDIARNMRTVNALQEAA